MNVYMFSCSGAPQPVPPPMPPPPPPPPPPMPYPRLKPCDMEPLKSSKTCDPTTDMEDRIADLIKQIPAADLPTLYSDESQGVSSLNIPFYNWWSEALHGVSRCPYQNFVNSSKAPKCCAVDGGGNTKCPTSFPAGITTSTSFNKTLFRAVGSAVGTEARVMSNAGIASLTFWTPNVNIFRDPRWGRGQECPGEDPTLNGDYAEGFVGGFQTGPDSTYLKASSCCKHYAAYNLEKWSPDGPNASNPVDRHHFNAVVTEQDLQDTYFPAFMSCANRGNASGVMCSYNAVNGVPSCASQMLLDDTLRGKWGFNGYVTSDCGAVGNVQSAHMYTNTSDATCAVTLGAGMDNDCGGFFGGNEKGNLAAAFNDGAVPKASQVKALSNMLRVQMRLGMFDPDASNPYRSWSLDMVDTNAHRALTLEAARQGMVLVKNSNNVLPFKKDVTATLAVVGPHANSTVAMQSNYHGTAPYIVSPAEGLAKYAAVTVAEGCEDIACRGGANFPAATSAAATAAATIILVGLDNTQEGEGHDRYSVDLPGLQSQLIASAAKAAKGPVVVVFIGGGACDFSAIKASTDVDAILIAGYPSQEGGNAIAQTIFGDNNPAGRLTQTWYDADYITKCSFFDMNMRPNGTCPGRTYRFYTGSPVFKFGEGMSYTEFKYGVPTVEEIGGELSLQRLESAVQQAKYRPHTSERILRISTTITNVGNVAGDEVVLLYTHGPSAGDGGSPLQSLRHYDRIHLEPGQSHSVAFEMTAHDFAEVDEKGNIMAVAGDWKVRVGSAVPTAISITS